MHLKNTLSKFIFAFLVFCFQSTIAIANAPGDPTGYKIALKIKSSVDSDGNVDNQEETHIQHFTSITTALNRDGDNGQWYPESISWTKNSNTDVKLILGVITDSYADVSLYFPNSTTGNFTFDYYDSDNGLPLKKVSSGSGTFTFNAYENSSLPFDYYFTDSFDKSSESTNLWPLRTNRGITTSVKDSKFLLSGTDYSLDNRWQGINANTILSLKKDWVVDGSAFNKVEDPRSSSFAAVGVDAELVEGGFSFDISIGKQGNDAILAEIYVESFNSFSDQYTSIWTDSLANEEDFRLINTSSSSTIYAQYYSNGKWNTLSELNWKTGVVTKKNTYSGDESTHEFTNWINPDLSIVAPFMDFVMPSYYDDETSSDQILPLAEGDLGFSSFSVTEGAPEPDPEYAPSSLLWKKLTFGGLPILVMANEQGSTKVKDLNSGNWEDQSYQWDARGTTATLYLGGTPQEKDKVLKLTFTSNTGGTVDWENWDMENGQNILKESGTDTFTISDFTAEDLPVTKGWMWFDEYPWVYSDVEGGWLYFNPTGSKLMVYSAKDEAWREMTK